MSWDTIIKTLTKGKNEDHDKDKELYCKLLIDNFSKLDPSVQIFIITNLIDDIEKKNCPIAPIAKCNQEPNSENTECEKCNSNNELEYPSENNEIKKWMFKTFIIFSMVILLFYMGILHVTDHITNSEHDIVEEFSTMFEEFFKIVKLLLGI